MDTDSGSFRYGPATLHYHRSGSGRRTLVAFHGFGQQANALHSLCNTLGQEYTVYVIELFFHGRSQWHARGQVLANDQWQAIMTAFLDSQGIGRFSLLGFSIGGKLATTLMQAMPQRIDQLYLVAPDGLTKNFWYRLATGSRIMRSLLRYIIFRPQVFFSLISVLGSLRLLNRSMTRFVASQMNTRHKRWRVYNTWITFRHLGMPARQAASLINEHDIKTHVLLGKYDQVITRRSLGRFLRHARRAQLHELNAGHSNLLEHTARFFETQPGHRHVDAVPLT